MQYFTACCFSHVMLYLQDLFVSTIKGISIGNNIVLLDYILENKFRLGNEFSKASTLQ